MWQRFTERARKVVFYAQEEAQKIGEGYVSTEHILLGLCREPDSTAALALERLGISLNRVRGETEKQLPRGEARPSQDMTLTPRAKRVIDLAYDEARALNNNFIGTEHLLLGLIREGDGLAGRVLEKLGADLFKARNEVLAAQGQEATRQSGEEEPPSDHHGSLFVFERETRAAVKARGASYYGTHDLLGTYLADPDAVATRVLAAAGVDLDALKKRITSMQAAINGEEKVDPIPSPFMGNVIEQAAKNARAMRHSHVNSGHALLAMFNFERTSVSALLWTLDAPYEFLWILVAEMGDIPG